jgi:hypothetical protein
MTYQQYSLVFFFPALSHIQLTDNLSRGIPLSNEKKKRRNISSLSVNVHCTSCPLLFSHFLRQLFERKRSFTQQFITPNRLLTLSDKK